MNFIMKLIILGLAAPRGLLWVLGLALTEIYIADERSVGSNVRSHFGWQYSRWRCQGCFFTFTLDFATYGA